MIPVATMPSSHQWLAVSTTTSTVRTRCSPPIPRSAPRPSALTYQQTIAAQATCTEGIAVSWAATPLL